MKSKTIFVSLIAMFAMVFALSMVAAASSAVSYVQVDEVYINDIQVSTSGVTAAGEVSTKVPVEIHFTAKADAEDVVVKVYVEGYKSEISGSTGRFHIVNGSSYVKSFSLELPSSMDLDDLTEELNLIVRISSKGEESLEKEYSIMMQKDQYGLRILSVDASEKAVAGSVLNLDVVLENNGNEDLENVYAKVSIPELGVEKQVYFGDLVAQDNCDNDDDDCDNEDTVSKKLYLTIPTSAAPGVYDFVIEAYNYDASTTVKKKIVVSGAESGILPSVASKTISVNGETTFDVVLVNPNDRMVVYSITPEESKGLIVEVAEPIVAVGADSSKTVKISVKATDSAEEGTHVVTVNVNGESGLIKQVSFTVNVEKTQSSNAVLILTVVLAIVFVVLLVVLIVLLTKKPEEKEEFGETSYY